MKFTSAVFTGLIAAITLVKAEDFRLLVSFSPSEYPSSADFCTAWVNACHAYVPSDTSLFYSSSLCEAGDFSGDNTDTEARVDCVFEKAVTTDIFSAVGATSS